MSPAHLCEDCALGHIVTPAAIRMDWDLGSKWLCQECAKQYPGWVGQEASE